MKKYQTPKAYELNGTIKLLTFTEGEKVQATE